LAALRHDFSVITGGPGTGKTTTVTRLIGLLLSLPEHERATSIKMVAPTGKAAERMREAFTGNFKEMLATLPEAEQTTLAARKSVVVQEASTIHAFLGSMGSSGFRYHAGNPVSCDVLIVDESSMVDLELFIALLDALPAGCRIILLGDKNQLAAVGTGNVFTDLTGTTDSTFGNLNVSSADFHATFAGISGATLPCYEDAAALCGDHVVELTKSYRFSGDSEVGQLARLLLDLGRFPKADELSVPCISLEADWQSTLIAAVADYKAALANEADAAELLDVIGQVRVLCAVRRGEHGVEAINRLLAVHVLGTGVNPAHPQDGLPFIIRSNDKALGLANGDCGIFRADESGELLAYLPPSVSGGEPRQFNPFALPDWEAAFALTIHKSQGSEYESVVVVLPEMKRQFISWELVYTAITRGKSSVSLILPEALEGQPLGRVQRRSGLREELLD
jgi:exodeoxyribonuclease V alpha subunit